MSKYLNENGVKTLWNKTKEKIAEVDVKVDAIEDLTLDEVNAILADTIAFSISYDGYYDPSECQAEEGMTWREFANSEYNDNIVYINDETDRVISCFKGVLYDHINSDYVHGSDVIVANTEYRITV